MPNPNNGRRIEYRRVQALLPDERNPKAHDLDLLDDSMERFGFIEPIVEDGRTGKIISGHGRHLTLAAMEANGATRPEGIEVDPDGYWLAPVNVGWSSTDDQEASGALVALNRAGERGGWDDPLLAAILTEHAASEAGLVGLGYDDADLEALLAGAAGDRDTADDYEYSKKITSPQYKITGPKPDPDDLVDRSRADELAAQIEAADLPDEERAFLLAATARHYVFRYDRIAEFYAHSSAATQRLMEVSALVIIDFDDAVANGYVRLSTRLAALLSEELLARDVEVIDLTPGPVDVGAE